MSVSSGQNMAKVSIRYVDMPELDEIIFDGMWQPEISFAFYIRTTKGDAPLDASATSKWRQFWNSCA